MELLELAPPPTWGPDQSLKKLEGRRGEERGGKECSTGQLPVSAVHQRHSPDLLVSLQVAGMSVGVSALTGGMSFMSSRVSFMLGGVSSR